jgi:hypothetical protein
MSRFQGTIWCDNCGVEILWAPLVKDKLDYCCRECYYGLRCDCGSRFEWEDERRTPTSSPAPSMDTYGGN